MNTPTIPRYAFQLAEDREKDRARLEAERRQRALLRAAAIAMALSVASIVAARARAEDWSPGNGVSALPAWEAGACSGLRATGTIDDRRPIAVTVVRGNERMLFRCDPPGDGAWLPPIARTVRWPG